SIRFMTKAALAAIPSGEVSPGRTMAWAAKMPSGSSPAPATTKVGGKCGAHGLAYEKPQRGLAAATKGMKNDVASDRVSGVYGHEPGSRRQRHANLSSPTSASHSRDHQRLGSAPVRGADAPAGGRPGPGALPQSDRRAPEGFRSIRRGSQRPDQAGHHAT